jgi:hypothetical protein
MRTSDPVGLKKGNNILSFLRKLLIQSPIPKAEAP